MNKNAEFKSFLRWAGSKRQLIPRLAKLLPKSKRYVEPFMGSACLFFHLRPGRALLGDLNAELVNTFVQVRDHPIKVNRALSKLKKSSTLYYKLRSLNPDNISPADGAARFIFLNRYCFNGLYRTNRSGKFNVPYAPAGTGELPDLVLLRRCSASLKKAKIVHGDFEKCINDVRKDDFVYLDPPFAMENRRVFREYSGSIFSTADLVRLSAALVSMDRLGAKFVVSYADCSEGRAALKPWNSIRVRTRRNIAGFSKHRRHAYELLATNMSKSIFEEGLQ